MRKLFGLAGVIVLAVSLQACCSTKLEREAVLQLEANHAHIFPRYAAYVEKDPALTPGAKDSEKKLLETTKRAVDRLKARTEE